MLPLCVLTVFFAGQSFAQDTSLLELEAHGILEGDITTIFSVVVLVLLLGIGLISVWSYSNYLNRERGHPIVRPRMENLFFGIRYQIVSPDSFGSVDSQSKEYHKGYLLSLGMRTASFLSENGLKRGDKVYLCLESFPNFDDLSQGSQVAAEVIKVKPARGDQSTEVVYIKFLDVPKSLQAVLSNYLKSLASHQAPWQHV